MSERDKYGTIRLATKLDFLYAVNTHAYWHNGWIMVLSSEGLPSKIGYSIMYNAKTSVGV